MAPPADASRGKIAEALGELGLAARAAR
jgi:hypothetical protein